MKKQLLLLAAVILLALTGSAQAPQQFNYQAVVRDASGNPVANNTTVNLRFTIHDLSASGTTVYTETDNTFANQFGLVNVQIGSNGNLSTVNWGTGAKYLQVEVEVGNASTFTSLGATQLISVPYALFAGNSNAATGPTGATGNDGTNGTPGVTNGAAGATGPTGPDRNNSGNNLELPVQQALPVTTVQLVQAVALRAPQALPVLLVQVAVLQVVLAPQALPVLQAVTELQVSVLLAQLALLVQMVVQAQLAQAACGF